VPLPQTVFYQQGDLLIEKVSAFPESDE
jgi:hypothetical protein